MEYLDRILERLRDLTKRLVEALLGPAAEAEPSLIPIPVNEPRRR